MSYIHTSEPKFLVPRSAWEFLVPKRYGRRLYRRDARPNFFHPKRRRDAVALEVCSAKFVAARERQGGLLSPKCRRDVAAPTCLAPHRAASFSSASQ